MKIVKNHKVVIAVVTFFAIVLCLITFKHFFLPNKAVAYMTSKVVRADLQTVVMATGVLQASKQVDVGAQVSGQLKTLMVKLGDHVMKGQLLAEIDPELSQNTLLSAKASMDSLNAQRRAVAANLWQAELAYRRQMEMIAKDATSNQEVEAAKAQLQVIRANLASFDAQIIQAKTQVDSAHASLAFTNITAPMEGDVVAIVTQEGQTVVAAQQAPVILKLANQDTMTAKAQISEADVIHIQPNQNAYFTILGDSENHHAGSLRAIEPAPQGSPNDATRSAAGPIFYNALFETGNLDRRLRIGMTAQVTIILSEVKHALTIPISAIGKRTENGRYFVRILESNGAVTTKTVAVGINNSVSIQVVDGLKEGDQVITATSADTENSDATP